MGDKPCKIFALVLEHCPSDLEEVLKTLSAWEKVHDEQDAIQLLKMVRNVAMDQSETKQTVMSYVKSFYELFTFYQDKHATLDNYNIMEEADEEMLACHFILGSDNRMFKELKKAMANTSNFGSDDY